MSQHTPPNIAVIGAGPAGLSAAYRLRDRARITLFEREARPGGHASTVEVEENGRVLGLDTAFIVFNRRFYPQLCGFFDELGVEAVVHPGGFEFFDLDSGLEFGTEELELDEASIEERYAARFPYFPRVWREVRRFHEESRRDFVRGRADVSMGEYLDRGGYSEEFRHSYLILLCSAVWSVPPELVWEMPAATVIAFFVGHDEGGLGGRRVDWRTVGGGSISYVRKALAAIGPDLRLAEPATAVRQEADGVRVTTASGTESFDYAVLATHADEAFALLENPTDEQRAAVEGVRYSSSRVSLHRDASLMPGDRSRWGAWNYGKVEQDGVTRCFVTYYLNRLQDLSAEQDYFVTLDPPRPPAPGTVVADFDYTHPVIDMDLRARQPEIHRANEGTRVKLAGSYFHSKELGPDLIGSHEAAFSAGAEAAARILAELD
ncbi:FAD-dependent oxidoreductase [Streptomyces sp. SID13726]|uniref:NAD(P)/FAD-dependent oxidoreductase n=1 Tax=Streptomyces sp. SID13726 TaxID=2706058 RepID=UPI0013BAE8BC|nr:FAD-dependent oxidoreductase [Streptomyces sp. SID13726]NEB03412.1 FAD-dependent oxidoreductase [Streptomyces sp. SID13726]